MLALPHSLLLIPSLIGSSSPPTAANSDANPITNCVVFTPMTANSDGILNSDANPITNCIIFAPTAANSDANTIMH